MVGGDPVGSTDPEVKRNTIPSPYRHVKCLRASFWRLNAHWCTFWAFNARVMHVSGVERQNHACSGVQRPEAAHFGRSAPEPCSVLALNTRQMLLQGVIFLLLFLLPFSIFIFIL